MKIIIHILILFLFHGYAFSQETSEDIIRMAYIEGYPPLCWSEGGKVKGIFIDLITEVLQKRMGIQVSHETYPWARAQAFVKTGESDALITLPTNDRKTYTEISNRAVLTTNYTLFANTKNKIYQDLAKVRKISDLAPYQIVQLLGSGWAKNNLKGLNVNWVSTAEQTFRMLAFNRADVYITNSLVGNWEIKKLDLVGVVIEIPEANLRKMQYHFMIRKTSKYARIIPKVDQIIESMYQDGTAQKIIMKYKL